MKLIKHSLIIIAICAGCSAQSSQKEESNTTTSIQHLKYLGQKPPGMTPEVFAPGLISTPETVEFGSVFNKDGTEFYYSISTGFSTTLQSRLVDTTWTAPDTILTHQNYGYNDPFLSPDENRLYVISERSEDGEYHKGDHDIWYVERKGNGWSEPINAGPNINSKNNEYYISFTRDGSMYFGSSKNAPEEIEVSPGMPNYFDIHKSEYINGEFQPSVALGPGVNTDNYEADVYVDPDEDYMIFCSIREEGLGNGDLYISFKQEDDTWSEAKNMGEPINSGDHELCPFVTRDGKYLFYTTRGDIYWVDAGIIENYR